MYQIQQIPEGFLLTFAGMIDAAEMRDWVSDSRIALAEAPERFGVIVDMRSLRPLPEEAQEVMVDGQGMYKQRGMERSAVAVDNAITAMQFKRLAKRSGIYRWERYISVADTPNWSDVAQAWVTQGKDPDT